MIDINPNTKVTKRTIYTASTWLQEVGGFSGALTAICLLIFPFFHIWPLEKYLINALYRVNKSDDSDGKDKKDAATHAKDSIHSRVRIKPSYKNEF